MASQGLPEAANNQNEQECRHVQRSNRSETKRKSCRKPSAAVRERERLRLFNESLSALCHVMPISLPGGRKLHKKQTLQMACRYIEFLRDCLQGKRSWEERRRFWCNSAEYKNMLNAIDAAAASSCSRAESKASKPRNTWLEKQRAPVKTAESELMIEALTSGTLVHRQPHATAGSAFGMRQHSPSLCASSAFYECSSFQTFEGNPNESAHFPFLSSGTEHMVNSLTNFANVNSPNYDFS